MKQVAFLIMLSMLLVKGYSQQRVFNKIDSLISAAQFDEAGKLISIQQSLTQNPSVLALLSNKGAEVLMLQGKTGEAEILLKKINSNGDQFLEAITKTNLGFLYLTRARNDLALENLQVASAKFQESGNGQTREAAKCLSNLSLLYFANGKLNQAKENGIIALQIRRQLFPEESQEVAASYNDLGLVYGQTDVEKALEYYEKALAVYEKLLGGNHPKIAQAQTNIGVLYQKLKLYGDAINNFESAEAILKKNYPNGHPSLAFAELNLGRTYLSMNDKKTALQYLQNALALYHQAYGSKHSDISSVYNQIGLIRLSENNYEAALSSFQEAIAANVPGYENKNINNTPPVSRYYNGKVLLYSLRLKAQGFEGYYYGKTLKFENLVVALNTLRSCDTLIDDIRHNSADENDKIELGESANETYEDGVRIAFAMGEVSVHSRYYKETAFYFAEKSKSAVLQESIADSEAKSFGGIPHDLLDQEKNFKAALTLLDQKLSQKPEPEEEKYLRAAQYQLTQEYQSFVKKLEHDFPDYFNLKYNYTSPAILDLQKLLDDKTSLVSYFIAEKGRKLYQFLITQKTFKVKTHSLPDHFDKYLKGFTNSLLFSEMGAYRKSCETLSKILVPRLPNAITNLVIIPSGRLSTIPFEALQYKRSSAQNFKTMSFMVDRYAVSYEFSAGLIAQKAKNALPRSEPSIFLCAPVNFSANSNLNDLPGTAKEVQAIATLFPATASTVASYGEATEDLAKSGKLSNYSYLHFATHGIVNETSPELSRIYLQQGLSEDGDLFAGEIYALNLHAQLAVLSACQTGLGKFSKGEGVIGLSRALVYAGARNIMVSFWSVADESTAQLMTDFYKILLQEKNRNFRETLQKAKIKMIHDGANAEPFHWAPFVLIGF